MEEESLNWEQEREQRKKLFPNEPETKVAKDYYTSLMLREFYTTSPEVADIVDETVKNALKTMKYSRSRKNVFGERGDAVSLTDLPYCPYPVEDPDLRLLYGFFGRKNEFFEFAEDYTEDDSIGQLTDLSPI
ncbi:MAG: hypothetical protein LBO09_01925 [Candidatus Peribacteria bacterium]|jgi:hypothetical protein|nr:hypothetical protein [Candidatus Peribacteria bacterium]